jgi:hypothetical protein
MPLPALEPRLQVVQSLLLLLSKMVDQGTPQLNEEGLALRTGVDTDRQGCRAIDIWCTLSLVEPAHSMD